MLGTDSRHLSLRRVRFPRWHSGGLGVSLLGVCGSWNQHLERFRFLMLVSLLLICIFSGNLPVSSEPLQGWPRSFTRTRPRSSACPSSRRPAGREAVRGHPSVGCGHHSGLVILSPARWLSDSLRLGTPRSLGSLPRRVAHPASSLPTDIRATKVPLRRLLPPRNVLFPLSSCLKCSLDPRTASSTHE